MVDPDPEQGRAPGGEVLAHKGLQLSRTMRANFVWGAVERIAKAGSESSLVQHLDCIGCRALGGELKFHPWKIPFKLPRLKRLVADYVAEEVCSQVCRVPGCLDGVESVLPSLDAGEASSCLLQVPADSEGGVILGSQPGSYSESVTNPRVGVLFIPGTSLQAQFYFAQYTIQPCPCNIVTLITTPSVVTGAWFSMLATVRPP